jgi:hypothetical protein
MSHLTKGVLAKIVAVTLLLVLLPTFPARSQQPPPPPGQPPAPPPGQQPAGAPSEEQGPKPFTAEELEQIVAPIALYPDPLLAQIFMASTYPLEVVQAARFAQANANLKDPQLSEELKKHDWDDSVKSLVSFPQVLTMLNEKLDWTQKLGDAVLEQQPGVMDAVQRLRAKAQASGNLKSTSEQTVSTEPYPADAPPPAAGAAPPPTQIITIQPSNPQVVYVPSYNPTVVYGAWPYPAYPPYAYYPPGYIAGTALAFGAGMAVGAALWGNCNWGGGDVNINNNNYNNFTKNVNNSNRQNQINNRPANSGGRGQGGQGGRGQGGWQHSPDHRRGAQYRDAGTQQKFNKSGPANAASRDAFRGRAQEGRQELGRAGGQGPGGGNFGGAGQSRPGGAGGPGGGGSFGGGSRPSTGAVGAGGGGSFGGGGGQGGRQAGAFEGMGGGGRDIGSASQRGQSSMGSARSSGSFSGGGGGARAGGGGGASRGGGGGGGSRGGGGGGGGRGGGRR